jgi:hypothetical protein
LTRVCIARSTFWQGILAIVIAIVSSMRELS